MKRHHVFFFVFLSAFAFTRQSPGQIIKFSDWVDPGLQTRSLSTKESALATTTYHDVVLIAVDHGASTLLPDWFNNLFGSTQLHDFFYAATFGIFDYDFQLLKADPTHAFEMPTDYIPPYSGDCQHVHLLSNIQAVLQAADNIYDFRNYDFDGDGIVYVHFASIGPRGGGVMGQCVSYVSQDVLPNGSHVEVRVKRQTRGSWSGAFESVFYHESGHEFFSFPDMDHSGANDWNHYGLGSFDVMCAGGFQGQPSPYNPASRHMKGWFNPIQITSSQNGAVLRDFQMNSECFVYIPASLPSNAMPNERFYISYHFGNENYNRLYRKYPYLNPDKGGVLIWHTNVNTIEWANFYDRRKLPIDIECEHGKTTWNEISDNVINTGAADPLTGLDKLEIRKIAWNGKDYDEIAGPYYGVDKGDGTVFYTPDDGKDFAFYTNPNSNWYANSAPYSQGLVSGFSVKNIRTEGGAIKADFVVNDYTITQNATLTAGTWYINNTVTVAPGVTLTINPGAVLKFPSANIRITVNGALNVAGTASNPATIDFTAPYAYGMNGIQFNSGASGSFSYCNIKNASYGIYGSNATIAVDHGTITNCAQAGVYSYGQLPRITNSTFTGNGTAISISNTGLVSYPWISANTISSNRYGIYLYNSSPMYLEFNVVSNNTDGGIWCSHGSTPYMRQNTITGNGGDGLHAEDGSPAHCGSYYGEPGLNVIRQNGRYGVYATSSNVFLGSTAQNGLNSIYDNGSYEVFATYNSNIPAQYNWWNVSSYPYFNWSRDFRTENGASVNPYPALDRNPNSGAQTTSDRAASMYATRRALSPDPTAGASDSTISDTTFFDFELAAAMNDLLQGKRDQAMRLFEKKFKKEKDNRKKTYVLEQLAECYRTVDTTSGGRFSSAGKFLGFLEKEVRSKVDRSDAVYAKALELESIFLLDQDKPGKAVETLITLKDNYANLDIQRNALFNLAYIEQNILRDPVEGRKYFAQLKKSYPDDELTRIGALVLADFGDQAPDADVAARAEETVTIAPDSADIGLGNYPNPFNPTTTIRYQIPRTGQVTLKVFDILGREVAVLVNGIQAAGLHVAHFNGESLASGVYFYRLTAPGINQVKKMLMAK